MFSFCSCWGFVLFVFCLCWYCDWGHEEWNTDSEEVAEPKEEGRTDLIICITLLVYTFLPWLPYKCTPSYLPDLSSLYLTDIWSPLQSRLCLPIAILCFITELWHTQHGLGWHWLCGCKSVEGGSTHQVQESNLEEEEIKYCWGNRPDSIGV